MRWVRSEATRRPTRHEGTICFHPYTGGYAGQAQYLIEVLILEIRDRQPDINLGEIAVLYPGIPLR